MAIINGNNLPNTLVGTASDDMINGFGGNDRLSGLGGDDFLVGGAGADIIDGGAGYDAAGYMFSGAAVTVSLATNTGSGGEAQGDRLRGIEALVGSRFNDRLTGNAGDNVLFGLAGRDALNGAGGNDYLDGGAGADVINGGTGYDLASYFFSPAGVTVSLTTGVGLYGEAQGDRLISIEDLDGSDFKDSLTGNAGSNYLFGNAGNDVLNGGAGNDWLFGGDGADRLIGGPGTDTMRGEAGNDDYYVDRASDVVIESAGAGVDRILSSVSTSLNFGGRLHVENLTLTGTAVNGTGNGLANTTVGNGLNNGLFGLAGDDTLFGAAGSDTLVGGDGNDRLNGGVGSDTITTGAGADKVYFYALPGAANYDRVLDFAPGLDTFWLENAVFAGLAPGALPVTAFVIGAAAAEADDRIVYNPANGNLFFDPDGTGAAKQQLFADLASGLAITAADFFVV